MQLLQLRMPNEYIIHVICLLILPTEMVWSLYGINNVDMYDLSNKVTYRTRMVLMAQKIINSVTTITLSILCPHALWVTIEMPSKISNHHGQVGDR